MCSSRPLLLDVRGLRKSFGQLHAVNDLSFGVSTGEILGVAGPNGAGKTTMFDVISGLSPATAGQIVFQGEDITGLSPGRICHRGLVRTFQQNAGFDGLTLEQSVMVGANFGWPDRKLSEALFVSRRTRQRIDEAIAFVGLERQRALMIGDATVLERKLAMIASALATGPSVLMMDEPVGGLVPDEIDRVLQLIKRLRARGVTIVLIEHVMRFLTALADRILVMHHGARLFEGTPDAMFKDRQVIEVYLGSVTGDPTACEAAYG